MRNLSEYAIEAEKEIRNLGLPTDRLPELYSPIAYSLDGGGKRLRPGLLMMVADALGTEPEKCVRVAVGMEMFHNFTLLHDDVMDKSATRHGRPTVHEKWDANVAILSGDTMLTLATQLVAEVDDKILRPVLDTFNRMAIDVYEGQALDMKFEKEERLASVEEYIDMVSKKTGALLGASARIGALIAGASDKVADKFYDYGMNLGIAFQVRDDYLDVYGDESTFGKPIGGDINNGKQTFLLLKALELNNEDSRALAIAIKMPASDAKIKTVKNLYTKIGTPAMCEKAIMSYTGKALKALKGTGISEEAYETFHRLADKMTGRKK